MKKNYKFVYIGAGLGFYRKTMECFVWFENILKDEERQWVQETAPKPLAKFFHWTENILHHGSDNLLEWNIRSAYNPEIVAELEADENFDPSDIYDENIEPTQKDWKTFHDDIERWIIDVNEKYPVSFFIRPSSEYGTMYNKWHDYSLEQFPDKLLNIIDAFYNKPVTTNKEYEKAKDIIPSVLNHLLFQYFIQKDVERIPKELANKSISIITKTLGYDNDNDEKNVTVISDIIQQLDESQQIDIVKSLNANCQLIFFATYRDITRDIFNRLIGEDPILYLKNLLNETTLDSLADLIYRISFNIANVYFKEGIHGDEMVENENPNPILGAKIVELSFDYPDCQEKYFQYAHKLYSGKGMNDDALRVCKLQFKKYPDDPNSISLLLFNALEVNDNECVEEVIEYSLNNENIINNPYPLSNIIYSLNCKGTQEASAIALKLTKDYWKKEEKRMIPSLYINMIDTFIVANLMDNVFDDIINVILAELEKDPEQFGALIYVNLACYYAMKNDKDNVIHHLNMAKQYGLQGFEDFEDYYLFAPYKNDEEYMSLFK